MIPLLIQSYRAATAITGFLIVAYGAEARSAQLATSATDKLLGAAGEQGADAGGMLDVTKAGISKVRLGGTVANGDPLTADANSKAIKAVATAGANVAIIGFAESDGDADEIIPYMVAPGYLSNPSA